VKRWTRTWASWVVISFFLAACAAPRPQIKAVVGTSASFPPFESVSPDQRSLVGFDIDLMKAIAARSNIEVELTNMPYEPLLAGIAKCTYDAGIAAIEVDDNLKTRMSFSDPYFEVGQVIVVKQGNPTITERETLTGQTVGVQANSTGAAEVDKIPGAQAKIYPAIDQAFDQLIGGLVDAVVADNAVALSYVGVPANNLKIVGKPFATRHYAIAVCSQRTELLQRINSGLAAVRADGTLSRLTQQWITSSSR